VRGPDRGDARLEVPGVAERTYLCCELRRFDSARSARVLLRSADDGRRVPRSRVGGEDPDDCRTRPGGRAPAIFSARAIPPSASHHSRAFRTAARRFPCAAPRAAGTLRGTPLPPPIRSRRLLRGGECRPRGGRP
jgi:hypothetical protein